MTIKNATANLVYRINEKFSNSPDKYYRTYSLHAKAGRKYDRVFTNNNAVFMFVDRETGDIFKPAGYNAPAKHVRYRGDQHDLAVEKSDPYGSFLYIR